MSYPQIPDFFVHTIISIYLFAQHLSQQVSRISFKSYYVNSLLSLHSHQMLSHFQEAPKTESCAWDRLNIPDVTFSFTPMLHVQPSLTVTFSDVPGAVHREQAGPATELLFSVPKKGLFPFHTVLLTGAWPHLWLPQSHRPARALHLCQHTQHLPFRQRQHGVSSAENRRTMSGECNHGTRSQELHVSHDESQKNHSYSLSNAPAIITFWHGVAYLYTDVWL